MLLDFDFLAILNLLLIVAWPATSVYAGVRSSAMSIVMVILTIVAVILDIVFLALRLIHG